MVSEGYTLPLNISVIKSDSPTSSHVFWAPKMQPALCEACEYQGVLKVNDDARVQIYDSDF